MTTENAFPFKKIYLEISNICNLKCSFCPEVERAQFKIEVEKFRERLAKVRPYAERVCLHVMGEPLGHPQFAELIAVAEEMQVKLEITTNGTLLNEKVIQALHNSAVVQVNFSLQSFFDNFPQANPQPYLKRVFEFCDLSSEKRPDLYINLRIWSLHGGIEKDSMADLILNRIEERFSTSISRNRDPGFRKSKRIRDRIYVHFDSRFEWPKLDSPKISEAGSCYGLRNHVAILSEGAVVPCCLDKEAIMELGNIDSVENLQLILDTSRASRIKKGFENGKLTEELCQKCDYIQRFSVS